MILTPLDAREREIAAAAIQAARNVKAGKFTGQIKMILNCNGGDIRMPPRWEMSGEALIIVVGKE